MSEHVVVMGGGIAGMCTALALATRGLDITLLERDVAPPEGDAEKAFFEWKRRGASQFRHPHAFLGLMCNILQDNYPDLLEDFYAAGARRVGIEEMLPPSLMPQYKPQEGDDRLWVLMCRRATMETVLRRYIEQKPNLKILNDAIITGLVTEQGTDGLTVKGVRLRGDSAEKYGAEILGDVVVDATGRTTKCPKWFGELGVDIPHEEQDAEIVYYTRHYKLKPGVEEPPRTSKDRAAGDLGYIKFGVFPGDNGHFALILCLHRVEQDLINAITDGEKFDALARTIPGLQPWIGEDKAEPTTHSFGMADIKAQWRYYMDGGAPRVRNFFAVGDAAIRTNPLYGRGCSIGILHAHILADVLTATPDPVARAQMFDARTEDELRPIYKTSMTEDKSGIRRALAQAEGRLLEEADTFKRRFMAGVADAVAAAGTSNIHVFRGIMRSMNLLEKPGSFMKDWRTQAIIFRYMLRGRKKNAPARLQRGPSRAEMLAMAQELDRAA